MKQQVTPGGIIDAATPDEIARLIPRGAQITRIREEQQKMLDANGNGVVSAYLVPAGYKFEVRRVSIVLGGISDPLTGAVALNVAGKGVIYQRSDEFIEYGQPQYGPNVQIPGAQTWGAEQGPYLQNKEVFEVKGVNLTPSVMLTVITEGVLIRPAVDDA